MGKGRITNNLSNGQYDIDYLFDISLRDKKILVIETVLAELTEQKDKLDTELTTAQAAETAARNALNVKLATISEITPDALKEIQILQVSLVTAELKTNQVKAQIADNDARSQELTDLKTQLNNLPEFLSRSGVWCADLSPDMTTGAEVGIFEAPGEDQRNDMNIRPAGGAGKIAPYNAETDGIMVHALTAEKEQVFYNLAMTQGWLKFNPRFRYGVITQKLGDFADVTLIDPLTSLKTATETGFRNGVVVNITPTESINDKAETLTSIEIEYMTCNGAAFRVGDEVLIDFRLSGSPKIIGFKNNPRACGLGFLTPSGNITGQSGSFEFSENLELEYGRTTWAGKGSITISWDGTYNNQWVNVNSVSSGGFIYSGGEKVAKAPAGFKISGAALQSKGDGSKVLTLVGFSYTSSRWNNEITVLQTPWPSSILSVFSTIHSGPLPSTVSITRFSGGFRLQPVVHFNSEGNQFRFICSDPVDYNQTFGGTSKTFVIAYTISDTSVVTSFLADGAEMVNTFTNSVAGPNATQTNEYAGETFVAIGYDSILDLWRHAKIKTSTAKTVHVFGPALFPFQENFTWTGTASIDWDDGSPEAQILNVDMFWDGFNTQIHNWSGAWSNIELYFVALKNFFNQALSITALHSGTGSGSYPSNTASVTSLTSGPSGVGTLDIRTVNFSGILQKVLTADPGNVMTPNLWYTYLTRSPLQSTGSTRRLEQNWQISRIGDVIGSQEVDNTLVTPEVINFISGVQTLEGLSGITDTTLIPLGFDG